MGADDWHDPHDILPEQFREQYGDLETVADALRLAERQRSTTPDGERPKCPKCGSLSVEQRTERSQRYKSDISAWKCRASGCLHDFDTPAEETTIPMTDERTNRFEWIDDDEQREPDERSALDPLFAGLNEQTRTGLAIALCQPWHDPGASYREAAVFFPHSRYWIGRRVREWRDGEHRELVPDPSAEPDPAPGDEPPIDPSVAVARIGGDYGELVPERTESNTASSGPTAVATDGGRRSRWDAYGSQSAT